MLKRFVFVISVAAAFVACEKSTNYVCTPNNPTVNVPDSQVTRLQNFLAGKGLLGSVTRDSADYYYKIDEAGTGIKPTTCSNVRVAYQGKLSNDSVFTSSDELINPRTFVLSQLIAGWQLGLQRVNKGGKITLYLPPALAYGASGSGSIPGNSILTFEIYLIDVTN